MEKKKKKEKDRALIKRRKKSQQDRAAIVKITRARRKEQKQDGRIAGQNETIQITRIRGREREQDLAIAPPGLARRRAPNYNVDPAPRAVTTLIPAARLARTPCIRSFA